MIQHLYIHLPFCKRKCPYCDFYSVAVGDLPEDDRRPGDYGQTAQAEWRLRRRQGLAPDSAQTLQSIYLGGGSPSLFPLSALESLAETLGLAQAARCGAEWTLEINPEQVTASQVAAWRELGINRFSLGAQSFHDRHLATLGRTHSADQVRSAVNLLRAGAAGGRPRLSMDLIYAIPGQTAHDWRADLDAAIALRPDHLSAYGLTYYEGVALTARRDGGGLIPATDDLEADMFEVAHERLTAAGYGHYEISNYALPGAECRHNSAVWRGEDFLGLGAAAHSRISGRHYANPTDLEGYLAAVKRGDPPLAADARGGEGASREDGAAGRSDPVPWLTDVMLRLRTADGLDLAGWPVPWRERFLERFGAYLQRLADEGLACWDGRRLALTVSGWLVYDAVMRRFFDGWRGIDSREGLDALMAPPIPQTFEDSGHPF